MCGSYRSVRIVKWFSPLEGVLKLMQMGWLEDIGGVLHNFKDNVLNSLSKPIGIKDYSSGGGGCYSRGVEN